jgi:PAS domain S-box-containing protein
LSPSTHRRNREGWISPPAAPLVHASAQVAASLDSREIQYATPSLAQRVDEAAVLLHAIVPVRAALIIMGGLTAALIIPFAQCTVWVAGGLLVEVWAWFATRAQAQGRKINWARRTNFIASYLALNLWWLLLGALFWRTGTPAGLASGAVMFLAIGSIFALLFYTAPVMFLAAGAAPAIGALAVVLLEDGRDWRQQLPVWLMLGLTGLFNVGRALGARSTQQQQRWLAESLKSYEVLADNITDIIFRTDLDGVFQYLSPASLSALGYAHDRLVGRKLDSLTDHRGVAALKVAVANMLRASAASTVVNVRVRHADGRWRWLQTSVKLVHENGVAVGVIGVSRDVTDRVAADAALKEAKAAAEAANVAKARFLANVSHEIRTPMNGVLGVLHLLETEPISADGREMMQQAQECGRMLSSLLNDILDFSKIEAGKLMLDPASFARAPP